jgi:hypothetical protein
MLTLTGEGGAYRRGMTLALIISAVVLLGFVFAAARLSPSRSDRDPFVP